MLLFIRYLLFLLLLYVVRFMYVSSVTYVTRAASPSQGLGRRLGRRSDPKPLVRSYSKFIISQFKEILFCIVILIFVILKLGMFFCSKVRFVTFDVNLNLLKSDVCDYSSSYLWSDLLLLHLLIILYFLLFNQHMMILIQWAEPSLKNPSMRRLNLASRCTSIIHGLMSTSIFFVMKRVACVIGMYLRIVHYFPYDAIALWYFILHLILSSDVHPNPGPIFPSSQFSSGFLSFCNWNLNTLSKDDFYRTSLLEAHNANFNYDIISLCETSLNETIEVKENILPGYKFYPWNHPDGTRDGGVGIFYKESLPLRIRQDLSFEECLVSELIYGRKKIFFTVLYRNPNSKANSPDFVNFLKNFENLTNNIKNEKPYTMFFTGDFNGHTQAWYPDGDTNAEGTLLDDLFSTLNLTQLISEPTHFFRDDCKPSCIDLIITDQPNLVLDCGVRPSLDPTVKHQMIFCKINYKIPPLPKFTRKLWHFNRAKWIS